MYNKLEYLARLFQKIAAKPLESYVLSRLWHTINDEEVKIVLQQYVAINTDNYALTDVFFPQVKVHVEVNEPAHYSSEEHIAADKSRLADIERQTGHTVSVIDCRNELAQIHRDIDELARSITTQIQEQRNNGTFKPWQPEMERNHEHWKTNNTISIRDEVVLNTIEDICALFDADFQKTVRGYQRLGALPHPQNSQILLWWPSVVARSGWQNTFDINEQTITETHQDTTKKDEHFQAHQNSETIRYVFLHHTDILGFKGYKFVGVFGYDAEKSSPERGTVWKKIGDTITLQPNHFE